MGREKGLSGSRVHFFTRDYLVPWYRERCPGVSINDYSVFGSGADILCINALKYVSRSDFGIGANSAVVMGPVPVLARVSNPGSKPTGSIANWIMKLGLKTIDYYGEYEKPDSGRKANFIWELVDWNGDAIRGRFRTRGSPGREPEAK